MSENGPTIKFWGARGSLPAPLSDADGSSWNLLTRELEAFAQSGESDPFTYLSQRKASGIPLTHGGNTLCIEIRCRDQILVLDMGTGVRLFGKAIMNEMFTKKGLEIDFVLSHGHWDHIQGLPFFGPLHVNKAAGKDGIKNTWNIFGGTRWQATAEACLRGQMDPPRFPISWKEIEMTTHKITFTDVYDLLTIKRDDKMTMLFAKLDHPQETYGVRLTDPVTGKVIAYTTDNEPRDPQNPDPNLLKLASGADVWITDCQFSPEMYHAIHGGPVKYGWGHSYSTAVARTAILAQPKTIVLFHHDPNSDDETIRAIQAQTQQMILDQGGTGQVIAAWEGLTLTA